MKITFEVTDADAANPAGLKMAAIFLLHLAGETGEIEIDKEGSPTVVSSPKVNTVAPLPTVAQSVVAAAAVNTTTTIPTSSTAPALAYNVLPFTVPAPPVPSAAAVGVTSGVACVPAESDSAGIPWDVRIHQKGKSKKRDGTWKLQKGIDQTTVQTVVTELAARKIATPSSPSGLQQIPANAQVLVPPPTQAPPPPPPLLNPMLGATQDLTPPIGAVSPPPATVAPQVFLPPADNIGQQNLVPMPPVPSVPAAEALPASNASSAPTVPVPPVTAAGPVGPTYRSIIDKMTAGTRENKLAAAKVLEIVTSCGCPNLQQLNQMPAVWADVDAKIDLALAGLL